jgi:AhpD family alkylhydroperoxidase
MSAVRITPLAPPYAPETEAELTALMPPGMEPLTLFRTLAHNPRVLRKFRLGALLDRGSIPMRDRELVILRTSARRGCEYEWGVHVAAFAARVGLTEAEVAATAADAIDTDVFAPREQALLGMVDALCATARVSDALFAELRAHFDDAQIVELLVLCGYYHAVAFVANAAGLAPEAFAARFPA